jgi:hypothetical protein
MNTQGFKKKLRQIEQDITIADYANDSKKLFKLPKGLTVMDFSPRGIATFGLFHPNRFSIVVTHGSNVIDYSSSTKKSPWGALYQVHIPSETNESNQ